EIWQPFSYDYDDPDMNIYLFTFLTFRHILIPILAFIFFVNKSHDNASQPSVRLLVPFPKYKSDILELCKHQNGQVILDFKWNAYGFIYHVGFLTFYMAFLSSFGISSTLQFNRTTNDNGGIKPSLYITIVFGAIHLILEIVRVIQSLRMKGKFFLYVDFWFLLDLGAYLLPVITSASWLLNNHPPSTWAISLTNLLLDLKFMLFLRCFSYFGAYFAIILGVARK
ncbi:611_t:CDS:2, partial [Entrophospora sp. SA101]